MRLPAPVFPMIVILAAVATGRLAEPKASEFDWLPVDAQKAERDFSDEHAATAVLIADERPLGRLLRDDRLRAELEKAMRDYGTVEDDAIRAEAERSLMDVRRVVEKIHSSAMVARLFMDDRLFNEAERIAIELRECVEDFREQVPMESHFQPYMLLPGDIPAWRENLGG
jgi:hypothetical protein